MAPQALPVTSGVELALGLPDGARALAEEGLPHIDLAGMPNAHIAARAGWSAGDARLFAVCASAPSSYWAPGIDALVFARATAIAEGALGVKPLVGAAVEQRGLVKSQRVSATGARGRHLLGFAGADRTGILCSVACASPNAGAACDAFADTALLRGALVDAPEPGVVTRALFASVTHPALTLVFVGAVAVSAIALLLARRPRRP